MEATDKTSRSASIPITSYDTALCIIPSPQHCNDIDRLRSLYDNGYGNWPPHINLIYPFVAPELLSQAKERIRTRIADSPLRTPVTVRLNQAGSFQHRTNYTVFICESRDHGASNLDALRSTALEALGQESSYCNLHLTIGQSEDRTISSRDFLVSKAELLPQLDIPVYSIAILIRERVPGQDKPASRMRLWGIIDIPRIESMSNPSVITEFWLKTKKLDEETSTSEDDEDTDHDVSSATPSFGREIQPGTTYCYDEECEQWRPCQDDSNTRTMPTSLIVSSYNVLVDSLFPPARERDPLLLDTLLSQLSAADILVLQEVSDDFLSYFLSDAHVRRLYPYTTHGPPSQPDIGPLPSLRNVVILSKFHFAWELVPFYRRHKGAVVAMFDAISKGGSSEALPLVVAGIHLTCGLTDGSVAAKKVQLKNLKNYLTRQHASNPWVITGDFNITTSTNTIETALKNKSISQQTVKTLASIERMMVDAEMLDAWSAARVEGVDDRNTTDTDDLLEGEDGATFNPRENELAAAISGTSSNRPQRYDRILVRPQGILRINAFNHFGLPIVRDGVQVVPSDHSGIRASMKVINESRDKEADHVVALNQHPVQSKRVSAALSDTARLTSALASHKMFPTDEEVEARKDAYTLIKKVVLGSSDDEETAMSDIPMVIVPVGSYALGAWTSASDIDCLCIGSISSKTFFKLARQRLHRAYARGIRLLRKVEASTGTMLELSVNGVNMDLQYCPAATIVERWPELPDLHHSDPIFNLSMLSLRKLKPYRDISYILRSLPSLPAFRLAYRCIKLWALQRGIYSSKFGYLGGVHITLMLSWVCKRMAHDNGTVTAADLVATFFHHYANFDWKNDMVYDAFFHKKQPRYHRSVREPMVVLGFHAPNANVAHTSTGPGLNTLIKEFKTADKQLSESGMTWERFLGSQDTFTSNSGIAAFLSSHDSYVRINIQFWGRSLSKGKSLVGWVESRCLILVVDINKALPNLEVRIWPARFTSNESSDSDTDYQGCYLIGLSKGTNPDSMSKNERDTAKQALDKTLSRFSDQLQSDDKYYDPNTSWINVSLAKPTEIKDLQLDNREWGDYTPDFEPDSDDEEDLDEPTSDTEFSTTPLDLAHRPAPTCSSTPVSTSKLRPASDVLNRLRWDPNLNPSDYIVGYEDRFLGAKETSLEKWKTEQTDEEFIPQHRILYFKRRGDGVVVWERRTRVDVVFGSGVGAG